MYPPAAAAFSAAVPAVSAVPPALGSVVLLGRFVFASLVAISAFIASTVGMLFPNAVFIRV